MGGPIALMVASTENRNKSVALDAPRDQGTVDRIASFSGGSVGVKAA